MRVSRLQQAMALRGVRRLDCAISAERLRQLLDGAMPDDEEAAILGEALEFPAEFFQRVCDYRDPARPCAASHDSQMFVRWRPVADAPTGAPHFRLHRQGTS